MHWASGFGDEEPRLEILELLLQNGGDVNVKSSEEHDLVTPLHIASFHGCLEILKVLLVNDGDPWIEDSQGLNALDSAHVFEEWKIFDHLSRFMEENDCHQDPHQVIKTPGTVVIEETIYFDAVEGSGLIELHCPPSLSVNQPSMEVEARTEARTSIDLNNFSMETQKLREELKSHGVNPGPVTPTTKQLYLRQLFRLREERPDVVYVALSKELVVSKELQAMMSKPGNVNTATYLDHLVAHFTCPEPQWPLKIKGTFQFAINPKF